MSIELLMAKYKAKLLSKHILKKVLNKKHYTNEDIGEYFDKIVKRNPKDKDVFLTGMGKVYPNGHKAVHDFNLIVKPKEFIAFLGPSGCGKTTILRMIAGLEYISEGSFKLGDVELNSATPSERGIAMVFQNYALYPYMNVYDNIAFGLKLKTMSNPLTSSLHRILLELKNPDASKIKNLKHKKWLLKHPYFLEIIDFKNDIRKLKRLDTRKVIIDSKKEQLSLLIEQNKEQILINEAQIIQVDEDIKYLRSVRSKNVDSQMKADIRENKKNIRKQIVESMVVWNKSIPNRVEELTKMLGIDDYLKRKPAQLSGGQRQRVALARSISRDANIFLYDEPLSNLDAKLRVTMRTEVRKLHNMLGSISIYVTHDQVEAMSMADRIVVIDNGFVQQIGTPRELFDNPSNMFVARFIGAPAINLIDAKLDFEGKLTTASTVFEYEEDKTRTEELKTHYGKDVIIGFRPQDAMVGKKTSKNSIEGVVYLKELLGHEYSVILKTEALGEINIVINKNVDLNIGDTVNFSISSKNCHIFSKETKISLTAQLNEATRKAHQVIRESKSEITKNKIITLKERTRLTPSKAAINKMLSVVDRNRAKKLKKTKEELNRLSKQLMDEIQSEEFKHTNYKKENHQN